MLYVLPTYNWELSLVLSVSLLQRDRLRGIWVVCCLQPAGPVASLKFCNCRFIRTQNLIAEPLHFSRYLKPVLISVFKKNSRHLWNWSQTPTSIGHRLVAGLSPQKLGCDPRPVPGFVVDKVVLGQGFLRVLWFSLSVSFDQSSMLIISFATATQYWQLSNWQGH
jgi:hypothetical protein